jgi:putative ABC transport system permease protein
MFVRLLYESFRRQKRRKLLAGAAVALGVTVTTAMLGVATGIGDKINQELRSTGSNLLVTPKDDTLDVEIGGVSLKPPSDGAYLSEADLPKIKGMFWRNNIVGFTPMLPVNVDFGSTRGSVKTELVGTYFNRQLQFGKDKFTTGVLATHPWWKVTGEFPADNSADVLLGERLAQRFNIHPGDEITLNGKPHRVAGVLSAGGADDGRAFAPLALAQQLLAKPGAVRRVYVSALTKPEDELARRDPKTMNPQMFDRWYCSPYVQSIAYQLQETIPNSRAEQIRQVAQNEGNILSRIKGLMLLITVAALLASALAVSAAMATAILERRREVGLMKALGAGKIAVAVLFFAESTLLAAIGGTIGFTLGAFLARQIGLSIFNSQITVEPVLFPYVLALAALVTFFGSAAAIRKAIRFDPVHVLRGDA